MPYSVKGFFEIDEDMVQILLVLEVLFTQDSEVEDLFCGASSGSEPSLFFSNYFFSLGFKPIVYLPQTAKKPIFDLAQSKVSIVLILTISNLQVFGTGIKSWTSSNFGLILQFVLELLDLECYRMN